MSSSEMTVCRAQSECCPIYPECEEALDVYKQGVCKQ
jgi:hypothetical protein